MALFYNRVTKKNLSDPTGVSKWYLALRSIGMIGEKELGEAVADETTLNPKEAEMAFSQLFKVVLRYLLAGHTVKLAGLGTFKLTLSSEGSEKRYKKRQLKKRKVSRNKSFKSVCNREPVLTEMRTGSYCCENGF